MSETAHQPEVLTLDEAAAFLRVPAEVVRRQAELGELPARQIGGEWRLLRAALADWLRVGGASKKSFLDLAGCWADDETLLPMVEEIYRQRGRPMVDPGEAKRRRPAKNSRPTAGAKKPPAGRRSQRTGT